ncbi:STAS domain-containing protein [Streptomyces sp. NPDC052701]|uniref:STAS domain-containing protein n=1 Tax=Streptomyces sp. NPDC052701 TaxID=3155533 RepID=UPI0034189DE3
MTEHPSTEFRLTVALEPPVLTVRVAGDLDYDTSGDLVDTVTGHLACEPRPRHVRLDFRELVRIDSMGLSALLMVHRRTSAARAVLHLDNRPEVLERVLRLTDVLDHLTAAGDDRAADQDQDQDQDEDVTGAGVT